MGPSTRHRENSLSSKNFAILLSNATSDFYGPTIFILRVLSSSSLKTANSFTYDINTNTNYNPEAEREAGMSGMGAIARYLGEEYGDIKNADSNPVLVSPGRSSS